MTKKTEINGMIFKELIKRGYSLDGNTRIWNIADSKLWYLKPEQAQAFLDLENSQDYKKDIIQKEIDLINENIDDMVKDLKGKYWNIVDIGCGDGKKAVIFLNKLKGDFKVRYCPIDISSYMVEKALQKIKKTDVEEVIKFQWNISDFENISNVSNLLRYDKFKENFFLLLGNTLGNFEINELLYEMRSAMKGDDYLLIGNGLDNQKEEEILEAYNNTFLDKLLVKTLLQIGFKEENLKYGARFKNSRVEMYYTILKDCKITFLEKEIKFNTGDQIIVGVSYKYNKSDFISFMKLYFDQVDIKISEDGSYALALCKK
ncbi:MAG: L-histidine N(alpha)-methyltransferase [Candidatus Nanoarchaeia archaeon]|nr:L-histidine N(alpha)-methyltransferase [Candidatus Nanoarchaeia archaeon]MDD3994063.1 L-histidine N(alpha)-methyltransferase [Candidatus Nanoarchaeia archaeon]MDD4563686.1 L-histidine N(alpha)-methyltransferase [Candidatus Nanoarchaeia archaeon]